MAYTPTTWASGDIITSAKLNKMEQGIASGGGGDMVVPVFTETGYNTGVFTCDKTFDEVYEAVTEGRCFYATNGLSVYILRNYDDETIEFSKVYVREEMSETIGVADLRLALVYDDTVESEKLYYPESSAPGTLA